MLVATIALLLAAAPMPTGEKVHVYPLAAALVHQDRLYLVDVPTRTARRIPLEGWSPEEADLSSDKKLIAVNARPTAAKGPSRLFLVKVGTWTRDEVKADAEGDYRFPRFSADGQFLYFSAAHADAVGGPANPLRIHRLRLSDRKVDEVPTAEAACEFSPTPIGTSGLAHVTTGCFVRYELALTDLKSAKTSSVRPVGGPDSELAASPDGTRLLQLASEPGGLGFFLQEGVTKPKRIAKIQLITQRRLQPRFISPKDVLFVNQSKALVLDTKSSELLELLAFPAPELEKGMEK